MNLGEFRELIRRLPDDTTVLTERCCKYDSPALESAYLEDDVLMLVFEEED